MKIMVTGSKGMLGFALKKQLADHCLVEVDLPEYDLTDPVAVSSLFQKNKIDFVFNLAAFTNVDLCESEPEKAAAVNHLAVRYLAEETAKKNIPLLSISTDYVFSGDATEPYLEDDQTGPQSIYGKTKLAGEQALRTINPWHFIVRTAWLYGPNGRNFVNTIFQAAKNNTSLRVVKDQVGCPTYTFDLAQALVFFLNSRKYGTYHLVNSGQTSWHGLAQTVVPDQEIVAVTSLEFPRPAKRPHYSVLSTAKFEQEFAIKLPTWQNALERYKNEYLS